MEKLINNNVMGDYGNGIMSISVTVFLSFRCLAVSTMQNYISRILSIFLKFKVRLLDSIFTYDNVISERLVQMLFPFNFWCSFR